MHEQKLDNEKEKIKRNDKKTWDGRRGTSAGGGIYIVKFYPKKKLLGAEARAKAVDKRSVKKQRVQERATRRRKIETSEGSKGKKGVRKKVRRAQGRGVYHFAMGDAAGT